MALLKIKKFSYHFSSSASLINKKSILNRIEKFFHLIPIQSIKINLVIKYLIEDILSLIFPNLCTCCNQSIPPSQKWMCSNCLYDLPKSIGNEYESNCIEKKLHSKFPFQKAYAFLTFKEGNKTQKLLHALKYANKPTLATFLGVLFSETIKQKNFFSGIDYIIPVPLHPKKYEQRGYNQSTYFAQGISTISNIPLKTDYLIRSINTETQTKKSKIERIENVKNAFSINDSNDLIGKHILLVDDVITTGATLEACAKALLAINVKSISLATIAVAE